jgi:hypothetical protein
MKGITAAMNSLRPPRNSLLPSTLLFLLFSASAFAQGPIVHKGTTELDGFIGSSYGLDNWRVMGGGNVAYAVTRLVMPYAEFSYFPGIQRNASFPSGSVGFSVPVSDAHAGVHLRIPLGESPIVPYLVAGAGVLNFGDANVKIKFPDGTTLSDTIKGESNFAANFGGGVRIYTREHVGFRIEAKIYKPTGTYTDPFYKVEGGVFIQFK